MNAITAQLGLLHHTLGVTPERRQPYRNHFVAGDGHHDMPDLVELEAAGMMVRRAAPAFCDPDDIVFLVTEAGRAFALDNLPHPPKRSRYEEYLHSECCESFAEWMGIELPRVRYESRWNHEKKCHEGLYQYERYKRLDYDYTQHIAGDWKPTKKEAKASYKAALNAHKVSMKAWAAA